jgi:hypothetical protein
VGKDDALIASKWLRLTRWTGILLFVAASAACTLLLDRSAVQCHTDSDCARFGSHPLCSNGICTRSGLGPKECFFGTPVTREQFYNQCSPNCIPGANSDDCLTFDDCASLGICSDAAANADAGFVVPTPGAGTGTPPAPAGGDGGTGTVKGALPRCNDSSAGRGSVVYMTGSSNFPPLLTKLAPIVTRITGLTPVFLTTDSCTGARSMYPANSLTDHLIKDPVTPTGTYAQYFDDTGGHDCMLGPGTYPVDVGESEIFAETCGLTPDPLSVYQFPGPILPILFVVPGESTSRTISALAARQVLGNGGMLPGGQSVMPWNDWHFYYVRGAGTATTRLVGLAIDVPVPQYKFWGIDQGSAQALARNLGYVVDPDAIQKSIGILGSDYYDQNRASLKALAFQAKGQLATYTPDANSNLYGGVRDKINVRDGHYPIWGTLHFFAAVKDTVLVSPAAAAFVMPFSIPPISEELIDAFIDASWVPDCAMMVQRDNELGDFTPSHPRFPCNCHFDARVSGATPAGCTKCMTDTDCTDAAKPSCSFHYCEPRSAG